jgi:5-dehydro-2-deoxygluconokinase
LQNYGVRTDHVITIAGEARNSLAVVETRSENCQSVIYRNGAADFELPSAAVQNISYKDYGALIVTGTALAKEPSRSATQLAMQLANDAGLCVVMDVDYRPYSWASAEEAATVCRNAAERSNIVIGNDVEFAVMANGGDGRALAQIMAGHNDRIVVYKMGEHGAVTFANGQNFETPIFPVVALKPTGAGDAFMGGFITSLVSQHDIETCVRNGAAAAAIVVTRVGCAPAMPTPEELKSFIDQRKKEN